MTSKNEPQPFRDDFYNFNCYMMNDSREHSIAVADGTMEITDGKRRLKWYWIPRSVISKKKFVKKANPNYEEPGDHYLLRIPFWFALKNGIVI